jgi:2-keto-4-pentenoate hydratase/2-oxohepta-3-ene-1,7-dioic acid hydratase in catechol pathway
MSRRRTSRAWPGTASLRTARPIAVITASTPREPCGSRVIRPRAHASELPNRDDISLGCAVNGKPVQKGSAADLIFSVPELVARLSTVLPLLPGDLIFTGTPVGVGAARDPKRFLAPGDELVSTVDGIGEMRHRFVGPVEHG